MIALVRMMDEDSKKALEALQRLEEILRKNNLIDED